MQTRSWRWFPNCVSTWRRAASCGGRARPVEPCRPGNAARAFCIPVTPHVEVGLLANQTGQCPPATNHRVPRKEGVSDSSRLKPGLQAPGVGARTASRCCGHDQDRKPRKGEGCTGGRKGQSADGGAVPDEAGVDAGRRPRGRGAVVEPGGLRRVQGSSMTGFVGCRRYSSSVLPSTWATSHCTVCSAHC